MLSAGSPPARPRLSWLTPPPPAAPVLLPFLCLTPLFIRPLGKAVGLRGSVPCIFRRKPGLCEPGCSLSQAAVPQARGLQEPFLFVSLLYFLKLTPFVISPLSCLLCKQAVSTAWRGGWLSAEAETRGAPQRSPDKSVCAPDGMILQGGKSIGFCH